MRVPVVLALAIPIVVARGAAVYSYGRPAAGSVRTYYIAAEPVAFTPGTADAEAYRAAVYHEYTDANFRQVKPRPAEWRHLAFMGPLIRADVGDTVRVVFRNNLSFPASVHPDGTLNREVRPAATAAAHLDGDPLGAEGRDDMVPPGSTHVYTWPIPEAAGPSSDDHGSVLWMYHSHADQQNSAAAGLLGPMLIYRRGALAAGDR